VDADRAIALELSPPPDLRAETAGLLEKHGFAVTQVGVRLDLDARGEPGERADDIDLHPMRAEEVGFVRSCLATAVRRGLAGADCQVDLEDWIARNLALPPVPEALCLVASVDGVPVCHATGRVRTDEFTGERVVDVVDTFVLPEWKSRGLSRLATAALLDAAAAAGARSAHSSVVADGGHERLLAALGGAGWQETGRQWRRA
jgi:GNAT superfamily N-acetyltransferase